MENEPFKDIINHLTFYCHYVDDTFTVLKKTDRRIIIYLLHLIALIQLLLLHLRRNIVIAYRL